MSMHDEPASPTFDPESWKLVELWGGAFQALVPKRFHDVSQFRDVPSHQEVISPCYVF